MRLLSIDPGKAFLAFGVFEDERLQDAGAITGSKLPMLAANVRARFNRREFRKNDFDVLAIEFPLIYPHEKLKGDPNDLLYVALAAGFVIQEMHLTPEIALVLPRTWKGQTPKEIQNARDLEKLDARERRIIEELDVPRGKLHNVMDAVGIGLWKIRKQGGRRDP